jgi:hypothetical protein
MLVSIQGIVGSRRRESPIHCWWECKLVQLLWKSVWRFLKKLKIDLPYDHAYHSWAYIQRCVNEHIREITCIPMFIAALFTITKMESAEVSNYQ